MDSQEVNKENTGSRRSFMYAVARGALVVGIGALGFFLIRRSMLWRSGQVCIGQGLCRSCVRNGNCPVREAQSARYLKSRKETSP